MRRQYTDEDREAALAALAANDGNVLRTAKDLGIPVKTLRNWAKGRCHPELTTELAQMGQQKKETLAIALRDVAWQLAKAMPQKIGSATLLQCATSLGIAIDKMQLLEGKATSIAGTERLSDEQRAARLQELAANARRRRLAVFEPAGKPADGAEETGGP